MLRGPLLQQPLTAEPAIPLVRIDHELSVLEGEIERTPAVIQQVEWSTKRHIAKDTATVHQPLCDIGRDDGFGGGRRASSGSNPQGQAAAAKGSPNCPPGFSLSVAMA